MTRSPDGAPGASAGSPADAGRAGTAAPIAPALDDALRIAIEASGDGLWVWDIASGNAWFSDRWFTMLGYEPGSLASGFETWEALVHPDDLGPATAAVQALLDGRAERYVFEHRLRRKDGTWSWILTRGTVVERDSAGGPVRAAGTHTDMTERHRMEDALRAAVAAASESEARLRDVLESNRDAIFVLDRRGVIDWANPATADVFGRPVAEIVGQPLEPFIDPRDKDDFDAHLAVVARGAHITFERRIPRPDGTDRWLEVRSHQLPDGRIQAIARDVTERRTLAVERDRLALAVAQASDAIILTDPDAVITYVNPAMATLSGFQVDEIVGKPLGFSAPAGGVSTADIVARMRAGEAFAGDRPLGRKDGSVITMAVRASRLTDADGTVIGFLATARDVTLERALETKLAETARLESIGQLAGGVAHDFNNILTAILGHAELAAGDLPPDNPAAADLAQIRIAAQRAQSLTRQLLAFGRRAMLQPRPVLLGDVVADLEPMLRRLIGEDVALVVERDEEPPAVFIDPALLDHAITNLIVNARDAMPGGGTIRLATGTAAPGDGVTADWGAIRVSDEGDGIPDDVRARIFDPFFTTKDVGKGTGLGLAMVQGFVAQSGGNVVVQSVPGEGTTFSILLPPAAAPTAPESRAPIPAPPSVGHGTILVVEDEPMLRAIAERVLSRAGYEVLLARGGADALELLEDPAVAVDLLFTDVVMPGMSGLDLAARARARRPGLRLLVASGYTPAEIGRRGLELEGTPFLTKPYHNDELLAAVESALRE